MKGAETKPEKVQHGEDVEKPVTLLVKVETTKRMVKDIQRQWRCERRMCLCRR